MTASKNDPEIIRGMLYSRRSTRVVGIIASLSYDENISIERQRHFQFGYNAYSYSQLLNRFSSSFVLHRNDHPTTAH